MYSSPSSRIATKTPLPVIPDFHTSSTLMSRSLSHIYLVCPVVVVVVVDDVMKEEINR